MEVRPKVVDSMQTGHNSNIDKADLKKNTSKLPNVSNEVSGVSRTNQCNAKQNFKSDYHLRSGYDS